MPWRKNPKVLPLGPAQYVRMSTEHQKYSTENQAEIIAPVRRPAGVRDRPDLRGRGKERPANRRSRRPSAADRRRARRVSRLRGRSRLRRQPLGPVPGRRRERLLRVHLQARPASRSTTAPSSSRTTAASARPSSRAEARDGGRVQPRASAKVFAGPMPADRPGFRQGGPAGYGLRRQLIDEHRQPKGELSIGRAEEPPDGPCRPGPWAARTKSRPSDGCTACSSCDGRIRARHRRRF